MWSLFEEAQRLDCPQRDLFLDEQCVDDRELRSELEKLLERADTVDANELLGGPCPINVKSNWLSDDEESPINRRIGAYSIQSQIGVGGMGRVYLAVRCEDYEQRVAVKWIKRGMDTHDVLRRFRAERQVLARLVHPSVARLLDGGTLDGRPYFVMEYIEGLPIDQYCADRQLGISDRLRLFLNVCAG